jgi:hypothetical protein
MDGDYRLDLPALIKRAVEELPGAGIVREGAARCAAGMERLRVFSAGNVFGPPEAPEPEPEIVEPPRTGEAELNGFQREFERRRALRHAGFEF